MGTQSGTILRLQLGDKDVGKAQGKLKIISGKGHNNIQVIKVFQIVKDMTISSQRKVEQNFESFFHTCKSNVVFLPRSINAST